MPLSNWELAEQDFNDPSGSGPVQLVRECFAEATGRRALAVSIEKQRISGSHDFLVHLKTDAALDKSTVNPSQVDMEFGRKR
jgi:hypothetical protein